MVFESGGERTGMPPHAAHRAPHHTPQPLIGTTHPARAHHGRAAALAAHKARRKAAGNARHHRATVVAAGNPATVQLAGSDTIASWPLAQHVTVAMLTVGGAVVGVVFDPLNPSDALLVAAY